VNAPGSPTRFSGRSAIVTGAASGIGLATAQRLADEGARVLLSDIDEAGLQAAVNSIRAAGGICELFTADVGEEDQIAAMVATCIDNYGGVDVLVNNAAAVGPDTLGLDRDVRTMTVELWDRTMRVDLRSQLLGCRFVLPHMLQAGAGSIVNLSSVAGLSGDFVRAAYSAAKAGTVALTNYVATMYGKQGIRCNAVAPGLVLGPSARRGLSAQTIDRLLDNHLTPRLGVPDDIAGLIAFLASDEAAFITGQVIRADGGALSHLPTFSQQLQAARQKTDR
jgi:NAD(P)-dependent dehydrogenase (short-subunit alcohol dehydrogenase family)